MSSYTSGTWNGYAKVICGALEINGSISRTLTYGWLNSSGVIGGPTTDTRDYSLYCSHRAAATEFNSYSDIRVKSEITDLDINYCKNFILNMKPKKYKLNNEINYSYGYIAQELIKDDYKDLVDVIAKEGMEELIDKDNYVSPKDGLFVLKYNNLIPILAKNIENIYKEKEELEEEVKNLKQKNQELENQINNILIRLANLEN
jgi:hypothetical protein